ncbi:hypothetical protein PVAND_014674 [Polypedilum vanderplanki]|uniref:Ion transport domain-containing protein n=1 Tax=Polypedilum vanderplanki TaxID=319348 RepID=A0A9J6BAW1_POLVA|nr:hypothetical protein PVAND_014674 [Polypedilum vanderplanki]
MSTQRNIELFTAFKNGDIETFTDIMDLHKVNTNFAVNPKMTIFEAILSTPKSSEFIRKSVKYDASLYLKNHRQQYPLKFVIDSQCIENLMTIKNLLLENEKSTNPEIKIASYFNLKDDYERNSLQTLISLLSDANFDQIFELVKFLIVSGVNLHYELNGKSALMMLMEKFIELSMGHKEEVIDFMSMVESKENCDIFIQLANAKQKCNVLIKNYEDFEISFTNMRQLLVEGQINTFEVLLPTFRSSYSEAFYIECAVAFLEVAVERSLISIVDLLLENQVDVNKVSRDNSTGLPTVFEAFKQSQVGIFQALLTHPNCQLFYKQNNKKINILHHFFEQFDSKPLTKSFQNTNLPKELSPDQKICFNLLLNDRKCDRNFINAHDRDGMHILYKTVKHRFDYMTLKLLERGAYLGQAVRGMRKALLEEFLDERIKADEKYYNGDVGSVIEIDYGFLVPEKKKKENEENVEIAVEKIELTKNDQSSFDIYAEEMKPLAAITEKFELQQFLLHPVISSFILIKWKMISFLIYANLLLILFFIFSFIPFNVLSQLRSDSFLYSIFYFLSFVSICLLILRESMQFFISVKTYVTSTSNWIDIIMLLSGLLLLLFQYQMPAHMARVLRVIVILLAVAEYFNLLGLLPLLSVSIYTKMFRKVCGTFIKYLAFYSVMILGFAFSFYALNGDVFYEDIHDVLKEKKPLISSDTVPAVMVTNGTRSERFNNFYTIGHAIMKSFVMLTGEFEMSYVQTEGLTFKLLLLLFLFLVAIVLYNLLNALAVSDTQEIKSEAKLIDLHQRILTMHESEASVFRRNSKFGNWLRTVISLFPENVPNGKIFIRNYNRIFISDFETIKVNAWMPKWMSFMKKDAKLNEEILQDIHILLLKKKEKKTNAELARLKEVNDKKFKNELQQLHEMMRNIQKNMNELREEMKIRMEIKQSK